VTIDAVTAKKEGKVLVDYSPNCKGKTLVAPYSPRLVREQTVSTPLTWDEIDRILPVDFTMASLPARLEARGDLFAGWHGHRKDLVDLLKKKR
jgi:bifunctional non-homologous end joining protein LigD